MKINHPWRVSNRSPDQARKEALSAYLESLRPKPIRTYYDPAVCHLVTEYEARTAQGDLR